MLQVSPIRAFKDNYIWAIHDQTHAVVVDPGDAAAVQHFLDQQALTLSALLITHHHDDHTGGIESLLRHGSIPVYGPHAEPIPARTVALGEGDAIALPQPLLHCRVLHIPGHTSNHVGYVVPGDVPWLFCGDTLFGCGCGRLFEGSPAQMLNSLHKLAQLPESTLVYCAHEYTQANIRFALEAEPDNQDLQQRAQDCARLRGSGMATVPFTMALERATNPFLRCSQPTLVHTVQSRCLENHGDELSIFTALRTWKNGF